MCSGDQLGGGGIPAAMFWEPKLPEIFLGATNFETWVPKLKFSFKHSLVDCWQNSVILFFSLDLALSLGLLQHLFPELCNSSSAIHNFHF